MELKWTVRDLRTKRSMVSTSLVGHGKEMATPARRLGVRNAMNNHRVVRQVVVENKTNLFHVDSSSGDVRGHEDAVAPDLNPSKRRR